MNANIYEKANQIIKTCDAAYFSVIDENGYPSVSTVSPISPESILEILVSTNIGGNKEKRLRKDKRASICFRAGNDNITLVGDAEIVTDQATKSRCWQEWFINHYPGGETDPNYIIIKFITKRVSLWVDFEIAQFAVDQLLAVKSRCGLLCDGCSYRQSHGCTGCIALNGLNGLNGNPFWGECPVAKCCQGKRYDHCGECPDIPCENLRDFSCGNSEHSDKPAGARIAVCRAWAARKG